MSDTGINVPHANETIAARIKLFIINHWVSCLIELIILGVVASFTIYETHKTAEQTREMLARYDAAITQFAKDRTQIVDKTVSDNYHATKEKVTKMKMDDVKKFFKKYKDDTEE